MKTLKYIYNYCKAIGKSIFSNKKDLQLLSFVKDEGAWYIDYPEWTLDRSHLQMVAGADALLDEMSDNNDHISLLIQTYDIWPTSLKDTCALLSLLKVDIGKVSGDYTVYSRYKTKELWLCPVVTFVFGKLPQYITITNLKK